MAGLTTGETSISNHLAAGAFLMGAPAAALANLPRLNRTLAAELAAGPLTMSTWAPEPCKQTDGHHAANNKQAPDGRRELGLAAELDDEQLYVKLSTFWYCFLAFITASGLLVSLVSNMIIIYLFTGTPSLRRNPSNIIAVNLSLSDLLYCIQWPSVIYCSLTQSTWLLEIDFVCQTFGFITTTTASASVLTVLAMAVERALVIKYSIHAKSRYTMRGAWLVVLLIWLVSIGSSLPPLFGRLNRFTLDPSKTSCTLDYLSAKTDFKLYMLVIYIVYWILPGTIITICYVAIIAAFKRSSRSLKQVAASAARASPWTSGELADAPRPAVRAISSGNLWPASHGRHIRTGHRLRDSIRLSKFLGNLRRSSTPCALRLGACRAGQPPADPAACTPDPAAAHVDCLAPASNGIAPPVEPARRILKRGATFYDGKLIHLAGSSFGASRTRHLTQPAEDKCSPLGGLETAAQLDGHQSWPPDNLIGGPNESTLELRPPSRGLPAPHSPPPCQSSSGRQLPPLTGPRRLSVDTSAGPPDGRLAAVELAVKRLNMQRPLCTRPPSTVGSSNATISSDPSCSSRCTSRSLGSQLTLGPRLDRSRASRQTFSAMSPASASSRRPRPSWTLHESQPQRPPPRPPLTQTTCHFGNSSSQLSRTGMQVRLARMSFYLILLWLVSWTPIASLTLINLVVKCHLRANALLVFLANTMTKLGPTFDVFIYGISHPRIKKKFIQIIKLLLCLGSGRAAASAAPAAATKQSNQPPANERPLRHRTVGQDRLSTRTTRSYCDARF